MKKLFSLIIFFFWLAAGNAQIIVNEGELTEKQNDYYLQPTERNGVSVKRSLPVSTLQKFFLNSIRSFVNSKKHVVSSISELQTFTDANIADFDGSTWKRITQLNHNKISNGGSFAGTIQRVSSDIYWERQIYNKEVFPEWFGALHDWNSVTKTGTDATEAVQKAVNYAIELGGGVVIINDKTLINGTVYINPIYSESVTIKGNGGYNVGGQIKSSAIYRQTRGDVFRINYKADSTASLPFPQLYARFSIIGVQGIRVEKTGGGYNTGMTLIKAFRTQSATVKDCGTTGFDYLIFQPDADANNMDNYCDQWLIQNVNSHNSTKGFMRLYMTDASIISRFTFHDPLDGANEGITIKYGTTTMISEGVFWNPVETDATLTGSSCINLIGCRASTIQGIHFEYVHNESAIKLTSCNSINIRQIHSRYFSNIFFFLNNNQNVKIDGWDSWEDKNIGGKDIFAYLNNNNIVISNSTFTGFLSNKLRSPVFDGDIRINTDSYTDVTDANYTVSNVVGDIKLRLPNITANRTILLPNPVANIKLTIYNRNNSSYNWQTNQSLLMPDGTGITTLRNNCVYIVEGNSTGFSNYRVVSILSDNILPTRLTATQASSIASPEEGLILYVTNTNATFPSKGWWGFDGSTWKQLNNN
ncbi:hypothetical protein [Emticicia sp. W12TSBA100-4]|uniref:hypothetical protein n=1 Tax=Emticicia sp. W12TSBA100-4 TaxID=3160965 RepID=UPI0033059B47